MKTFLFPLPTALFNGAICTFRPKTTKEMPLLTGKGSV
jgi:hypothetical protein